MNPIISEIYQGDFRKYILDETNKRCLNIGDLGEIIWELNNDIVNNDKTIFREFIEFLYYECHGGDLYKDGYDYIEELFDTIDIYFD